MTSETDEFISSQGKELLEQLELSDLSDPSL